MIGRHRVGAVRAATMVTIVSLALVATALLFLAVEIARGWLPLGEPGVAQIVLAVTIFALSFPLVGFLVIFTCMILMRFGL